MINSHIPFTFPSCCSEFACKCGACRNTCCQQWTINISRAEYNKVRHKCDRSKNLPNGDEVFQRKPRKDATEHSYATMKLLPNGLCPLFSEGGLCSLQLELGYTALPNICRQFPRLRYQASDGQFIFALDLCCERVLELLLEHADEPLAFTQGENPHPDLRLVALKSRELDGYASDIRNLCIWIIQNRAYSLSDRLILLGMALRELEQIEQSNELSRIPDWFMRYAAFTKGNDMTESLREITGDSQRFCYNNIQFFNILSPIYPELKILFSNIQQTLAMQYADENRKITFSLEHYQQAYATFLEQFPDIEKFFEHCLVMSMFRWLFPVHGDSIWQEYSRLCSTYSLMLFASICGNADSMDKLIDYMVSLFRSSLNSNAFHALTAEQLEKTGSNSLAHMAILVRG